MKIKFSLVLVFIISFSIFTQNLWAAAPRIVSSIPANGNLNADPSTNCIEITFNERMTGAGYWKYNSHSLDNGTSEWSADLKTFRYCWNAVPTPIPLGSYWFEFNPAGHPDFKSAATGEVLPTTRISFTVTANGNNNNHADNTPPQVSSSSPADGDDRVDTTTTCLVISFNEDMDTNITSAWASSDKAAIDWPDELSTAMHWRDKRTLEICRTNAGNNLAAGNYTFTLNPQGTMFPFTDVAGNILPETVITFTVSNLSTFTYYIPYFSSADNHWTGLCISNNCPVFNARITTTLYNADGTRILPSPMPPFTIAANGQFLGTIAAGLEATGWARVDSTCSLSGLCLIGSNVMADIPFSSKLSRRLMIPHVAQTNIWDTDIMVCNPNNSATTITLSYYSRNGQETISPNHVLPALGSAAYKFSDVFPNLASIDGGKVKISVTNGGDITGFALYYNTNHGGSYFAGINADSL